MAVQRQKGAINSYWEGREDCLEEVACELSFERSVGFNQQEWGERDENVILTLNNILTCVYYQKLFLTVIHQYWELPRWLHSQESSCSAGDTGDTGSIPGLGKPPGERNSYPCQYSCLENPMDWGTWWATVHRVAKSQTRLRGLSARMRTRAHARAHTHTHTHTHQFWIFIKKAFSSATALKNTGNSWNVKQLPYDLTVPLMYPKRNENMSTQVYSVKY